MSSDDNVVPESTFAAKLAAARAKLGVANPAVSGSVQQSPASTSSNAAPTPAGPNPSVPDEDIPQVELHLDPEEEALDLAIKNLSIVDAYAKWCGKMVPKVGNKREGVMVSCPSPLHADTNPSAWLNLDKNVYYCPGCAYGGDAWDIAALNYGFAVPGYKNNAQDFRKLREMMALELGFSLVRGYSGTFLVPPEDEQTGQAEQAPTQASSPQVEAPATGEVHAAPSGVSAPAAPVESAVETPVGKLPSAVEKEQAEQEYLNNRDAPTIDWKSFIPEDTFLRTWLNSTTVDDCPEEYHLWTGLMAVGFAIGRKKVLWDLRPVVGNLFTCLVGPSGARKSQASEHLANVLDMTLQWNSTSYTGVKRITAPGSAEYLVKALSATEEDPSTPGNLIHHPVRALVEFGEMSTLMGIGGRAGSVLKPQLMDIYDAKRVVGSGSLTHGERYAREPFGQCLSTTQNDSLNRLLDKGDDASGFMNRWIFAGGRLKPPRAYGGTQVSLTDSAAMLNQIYMWTYTGASEIQWSDSAVAHWTEFFHDTLHPTKMAAEKNGSALLNRLDLLMKKLILLFTANMMCDTVPKLAVEQAIKLYPYLLQTFGVVSKQINRTEDSDLLGKVVSAIEKLTVANGKGPTKREIYNCVKASIKTTKQLGDLLKSMVDLELIVEMVPVRQPGQRGQLGVRYAVAN